MYQNDEENGIFQRASKKIFFFSYEKKLKLLSTIILDGSHGLCFQLERAL